MGLDAGSDYHPRWMDRLTERASENRMQAFSIRGMTERQEEAVRAYARDAGFSNLRGFNFFMQNANLTYYDIIKVASP